MKVILSGMFAGTSVGHIDNLMAYALGLRQLGHEVYVIEDVHSDRCRNAEGQQVEFERWTGRGHFESIMKMYGMWTNSSLVYNAGKATWGMPFSEVADVANDADLLLLVGGRVRSAPLLEGPRHRAYVDINPAKTQVYYAEYEVDYSFAAFDCFFTVGLAIGSEGCPVPSGGLDWHAILPPVCLDRWPASGNGGHNRFTTVSTWAGRSTFYLDGTFSGEKSDQWFEFIELPRRTKQGMEIALRINPGYTKDLKRFEDNGWVVSDPRQLQSFEEYRDYIANSRGEFSVANNRYVQFKTGWISDRTARYLASGRPVLIQSTGLEQYLPIGSGLLTFTTMEEAVAGLDSINRDYAAQCRAARNIAEEFLDARKVLTNLLAQIGISDRGAPERRRANV